MKKILKLQDHKHTAKRLSHKHTSYRGLFVILALFTLGFLFVGKTVSADSYVVTASVLAPIPNTPAVITGPVNGAVVSSQNVVISGTCPIITPAIVVILYRDGVMMGSAGCSAAGEFAGTFSLNQGQNIIVPKVMTITNSFGPDGPASTITYQVPTPPVTPPVNGGGTTGQVTPPTTAPVVRNPDPGFEVKVQDAIIIFKKDESFVWKVDIKGGESPYTILVDWGDGTKSTYSASTAGEQLLEHVFKKNINTVVRISVKDANGQEVYTTVAGVTFRSQAAPLVEGIAQAANTTSPPIKQLAVATGVTAVTVGAIWVHSLLQHGGEAAQQIRKIKTPKVKR